MLVGSVYVYAVGEIGTISLCNDKNCVNNNKFEWLDFKVMH